MNRDMHILDVLDSRIKMVLWDICVTGLVVRSVHKGSLENTISATRRHIPQNHLNPLNYTAVKPQISHTKTLLKMTKIHIYGLCLMFSDV